jgi:group I intron endonuclease
MECHQYLIRKEKELQEVLSFNKNKASLKNTVIKQITRLEAENIIKEYEYLKALAPYNIYYFGIFFIINNVEHLGGVLVFSHEYSANKDHWKKYDFFEKIILLSRGVCLHWTPINTASFFISRACNWLKKNTHYKVVTATTDALAGEVGVIYQSCNWHHVGLMEGNYDKYGNEKKRMRIIIDGKSISEKTIRKKIGSSSVKNVLKVYPDAKFNTQLRKSRYFYFIGNKYENKNFYEKIKHMIKPYPKKEDIIERFNLRNPGLIYKITNLINGKVYIGQTYRSLKERMIGYKRLRCNEHLKSAIIKYGFDNFKFEIIYETHNINELNEKEIFYIKEYNSTDKTIGYNIDLGGRNKIMSDETKQKMSKAGKGRKQTKEHVDKRVTRGEGAKKYGRIKTDEDKKYLSENSPKFWEGKKRDEETINKIKESKTLSGDSMPVYLYDLETKEIIAEYRSMTEAAILTKYSYTKVSKQCKFLNKIYSKQIFTLKNDFEKNQEKLNTLIYKRTKGTN